MSEGTPRDARQAPRTRGGTALVAALAAFVLGVAVDRALSRDRTPPGAVRQAQEPASTSRRVRMSALLLERAGVRTAPVTRRALTPALELVGSVEFDGDRVAEVGSRVAGRVARVFVAPGAAVRAGDALAEVESAAIGEAAAAYVTAQARVTAARAEATRLAGLARQHLATAREVEHNRAELAAHEAEARGAAQRLRAMGLTPGPRLHRVTLRAPIGGRVVARPAVLGQVVEPTASLFRIADPSRLWVQLEVFERDLARVREDDTAEITSEAHPGRVFRGTVGHLAATIAPETRTARVRIAVANPDDALRPGQFVTARVRSGAAVGRSALVVHRSAVVQFEGQPAVFVATGRGEFEVRPLELGVADGDDLEAVRGISDGEALVIAGAFALKSELLR